MTNPATLITDHLDTWSSAIKAKSSAGRGGGKKQEFYGFKKLRELILELAVRGLLVPQDPNDEPASELLRRIATRKAKLIKDGEIRKQPILPPVHNDEFPFSLPSGWRFERVGNLTSKLGSGSTPRGGKSAYVPDGIIFLRSQNVWNDGLKLDDTAYIPEETHEVMQNTQVFPRDVLLNITGASLGRSTVFPKKLVTANVSQHVTIIRLIETEMADFLHLGILSPLVQKLVWGRQVGMAIEGLSKKVLEQFEFPIPPLAEQHRIVAKVDELMALCDQLELRQEDSVRTHVTLVETLLGALTAASERGQFDEAWQRIASHFDTLFSTESSIDQLKQTLLQLAVMGKLVPQDPSDEPAAELLKKVATTKGRLIKAQQIKKQKTFLSVSVNEMPFNIPKSWVWVRLGNLGFTQTGGTPSKSNPEYFGADIPFIKPADISNGSVNYQNEGLSSIGSEKLGRIAPPGSILMVCIGTIGKCAGIDRDCAFNQQINSVSPYLDMGAYLYRAVSASFFQNFAWGKSSSTTIAILNKGKWENIPLPVPPLAEQRRIVAKVDELMTLCDRLKASLQTAQATQLHLADSLVEAAIH